MFYCWVVDEGGNDKQHGAIETLFFGHVSSNDMIQDSMALASFLDAILARLRIELPSVTEVHILSDNARCYQNDILPVIAPYIAKHHDLFLSGIIHSETQRGKSFLDAHFALAMMHVNRYCRETRRDITTPGDIVTALNSFGDVANCTAEMVHISKDNEQLKKWMDSKKEKKLIALGRVNEVLYSPWQGDEIIATCFKLSGRESAKYEFRKYSSIKEKTSTAPNRNSIPAKQGLLQQTEDDTGDDSRLDNNENLTEGAQELDIIHHRRPSEVEYQGLLTGVYVWPRSCLRKQRKPRKSSSNCGDEIRKQTDMLDEEHAVMESEHGNCSNSEIEDEEQSILRTCPKYKEGYKMPDYFSKHMQECQGLKDSMQILDRACRMAFQLPKGSELSVYTTKTRHPAALTISITNDVIEKMSQKAGWAERPAYRKTLSNNTVHRYVSDIDELFDAGQKDKGKKMSASIMKDVLRKKYPDQYDIPSEHFKTGYVSSLVRKHKREVGKTNRHGYAQPTRKVMATVYVKKLGDLSREDGNLMPRMAISALISALDIPIDALPADFPRRRRLRPSSSQSGHKCGRKQVAMYKYDHCCCSSTHRVNMINCVFLIFLSLTLPRKHDCLSAEYHCNGV